MWKRRDSLSGQSSPGTLHDGQQPSNGTRQIPHTSSSSAASPALPVSHCHCAIACHRRTCTFMLACACACVCACVYVSGSCLRVYLSCVCACLRVSPPTRCDRRLIYSEPSNPQPQMASLAIAIPIPTVTPSLSCVRQCRPRWAIASEQGGQEGGRAGRRESRVTGQGSLSETRRAVYACVRVLTTAPPRPGSPRRPSKIRPTLTPSRLALPLREVKLVARKLEAFMYSYSNA